MAKGLKNVLDIGCGPAHKLMTMVAPHAETVGVDQPTIIEIASRIYSEGRFVGLDLEQCQKTDDETFDLVLSAGVIEHLLDPDPCMEYIRRSCHKDSLVMISTVDRDTLRGPHNTAAPNKAHVREWNRPEFARYIESCGFQILSLELVPPFRTGFSRKLLKERWYYFRKGVPFRNLQRVLCRPVDNS